jgi:(S)-2-hydroxyglutarate dehydrogenase
MGRRVGVVGGGILGVAVARRLLQVEPEATVTLLDKETQLGRHQTGHNSGVVHAGIYYQPGSLKAQLCRRGAVLLKEFCGRHQLA